MKQKIVDIEGRCYYEFVIEDDSEFAYQVPEEFEDYKKIMEFGAKKYGADNWLEPNGSRSSFKNYHDSAFHHLANSYAQGSYMNLRAGDIESHMDHLLHAICNLQMIYTRLKRGIRHKDDK